MLFFTTGNPLTKDELEDLVDWVKAGGAFAGTHCGSDTLYPARPTNERGVRRAGRRPTSTATRGTRRSSSSWKTRSTRPRHGFKTGDEITDEIYQFRHEPYSRNKLHIILSVDNASIDVKKGKRADKDFAIAWCQEVGKGRRFYTSLGHRKEVWKDPRFQEHLIGGLKWAMKLESGDATPSAKIKK